LAQLLGIIYPLIFKQIIDSLYCKEFRNDATGQEDPDHCSSSDSDLTSVKTLIIAYAATKFASDLINGLKDYPFARIQAEATTHITKIVHLHVQN